MKNYTNIVLEKQNPAYSIDENNNIAEFKWQYG